MFAQETKRLEHDVSVQIEESYDDNITFANQDTLSDMLTALTMGYSLKHEGKKDRLNLESEITHQFFIDQENFNNLSQELMADYRKEFSAHSKIFVTEEFTHAEEPRSFQDAFGQDTGRFDYYLNRFQIQHALEWNKDWTFITDFENEFYDPARNDISLSVLNAAGLEADYALSPKLTGLVGYQYRIREYDAGGHIQTQSAITGLRKTIQEKATLDLRVRADTFAHEEKIFTKPGYSLNFDYALNQRTMASIVFLKKYDHYFYSQELLDAWTIRGEFSRQIWKRFQIEGAAFYGKGQFLTSKDKEEFIGSGINTTYEMNKHMSLAVKYEYTEVFSNNEIREYAKNVAGLSFRWRF
jgi:hypothetical protein